MVGSQVHSINKSEYSDPTTNAKFQEDQKVCEIWKDLDRWIKKSFDAKMISSSQLNNPVMSASSPCLDENFDDVESGIVCDGSDSQPQCLPHSSSCSLCNKPNRCSDATSESQRRSRYHYIANKERSAKPNVLTIRPCFEGTFIFLSICFVLVIFLLWLSRFFNLGLGNIPDRSAPNTILNWWSPLRNGKSN